MTLKGISFNTRMVKAIRNGRKTQTRRPKLTETIGLNPGDVVFVKEAWKMSDGSVTFRAEKDLPDAGTWQHPASLSPKDARIFLVITGIRTQRVKSITVDECKAEGLPPDWERWGYCCELGWFEEAWDESYDPRRDPDNPKRFEANPEAWVVEFSLTERP